MSRVEEYRLQLQSMADWDSFLLKESRLPGPRANLELAFAVAQEGSEDTFLRYAGLGPEEALPNTALEFLPFCGVLGLGYLSSRGAGEYFRLLRSKACDPRWRIREAVALGLQEIGRQDIERLLPVMATWSEGNCLERRAVVAALCEPSLLEDGGVALSIAQLLDAITAAMVGCDERRSENFRVLRQTLAYGWSVIVAAQPEIGKPLMEAWMGSDDPDIRWIMKQNLQKARLVRMDAEWVQRHLDLLNAY